MADVCHDHSPLSNENPWTKGVGAKNIFKKTWFIQTTCALSFGAIIGKICSVQFNAFLGKFGSNQLLQLQRFSSTREQDHVTHTR